MAEDNTDLTTDQLRFLGEPRCAVVSTVGGDGAPHQAVLHYHVVDGGLLMNGRVDRRWAINLRRDPRLSVLVHDAADSLHWVGMKAVAELLTEGAEAVRDAMVTARRYGEDPTQYQDQRRVSFLARPTRVIEYRAG